MTITEAKALRLGDKVEVRRGHLSGGSFTGTVTERFRVMRRSAGACLEAVRVAPENAKGGGTRYSINILHLAGREAER